MPNTQYYQQPYILTINTRFFVYLYQFLQVLASFAILVNLLLIFNLYKKMRKSQLWAVGLNNYKTKFPNCSLIEEIYSRHYPFGMLKTTQWVV